MVKSKRSGTKGKAAWYVSRKEWQRVRRYMIEKHGLHPFALMHKQVTAKKMSELMSRVNRRKGQNESLPDDFASEGQEMDQEWINQL